nr:MAG TPA: hypothetical protein [Caudoviricetes sp.]
MRHYIIYASCNPLYIKRTHRRYIILYSNFFFSLKGISKQRVIVDF